MPPRTSPTGGVADHPAVEVLTAPTDTALGGVIAFPFGYANAVVVLLVDNLAGRKVLNMIRRRYPSHVPPSAGRLC